MGAGRDAPTERAVIRDWRFRGTVILAGVIFAMYHGEKYYEWAKAATFTFLESSRALRQIIRERDAVVVGEFAAQVTFETRYKHYYIRPKLFNASGDTLVALGITHLVAHKDDLVTEVMRRNAPHLLQRLKRIGQIEFYGLPLNVYELVDLMLRRQGQDLSRVPAVGSIQRAIVTSDAGPVLARDPRGFPGAC